jgi:hypothetical protein
MAVASRKAGLTTVKLSRRAVKWPRTRCTNVDGARAVPWLTLGRLSAKALNVTDHIPRELMDIPATTSSAARGCCNVPSVGKTRLARRHLHFLPVFARA